MTDISTIPNYHTDMIGPGRLVLVVGPSGAGKDTLIGLAQAASEGDQRLIFPRRVVTRDPSVFENNEPVSPTQFGQMLARGDLAFQWEAHGLRYGLPRSIVDEIRSGSAVVVNASRTIIESARRSYANVIVVLVTAPSGVLAQRIASRARTSDGRLDDRIRRTVSVALPDVIINNVERAEDHAIELLNAIRAV